ncbi:MAG: hypothetical protein M5U29_12860 [Anaerolineae bacterium]|nr:hypothetical protein [Anaerolineae bacterium]
MKASSTVRGPGSSRAPAVSRTIRISAAEKARAGTIEREEICPADGMD